ncbi:MAG: hypothetical protein IKH15_11810 [Bacteroidales bacterium]|nr:hypothetical protein [Bacteroidales bacterium]
MAEIISLQEDWDNHNGDEVEAFLKNVIGSLQSQVQGKYGHVEVDGTNISFYEDENSETPLKTIALAGTVYRVEVTASESASFNVLSSDTSKSLTFSAESFSAPFGSSNWTPTGEDFTYTVSVDNGTGQFVQKKTGTLNAGAEATLAIRGWLTTGQNRLKVIVTGNDSGQQATKVFTVNVTTLFLESAFSWQKPWIEGEQFWLDGIRFSGNLQKTLYISIDGDSSVISPIVFPSGTNYTSSAYAFELTDYFPEDLEESGIHTIEIWMEGGGVSTQSFRYNVMCVKAAEKNTAQLIAINNIKDKASNFVSEVLFQFAVYNVTSVTFATEVTDGEETVTDSKTIGGLQTRTKNDYNSLIEFVTSATEGVTLTVEATAGTATEEVTFTVDNSTAFVPTAGETFYMNAATRNNGSDDKTSIINQAAGAEVEEYEGVWTGFSFGDTDGWTNDGIGSNAQRALVAKAGCHVEFAGIKPLGAQTNEGNATIELKFKSENIADYDTPVLSFGETETVNGVEQKRGIFLYPTKLVVLGNLNQNTVLQSIGLEEGEVHHITIVFQKGYGTVTGRNLCTIYMNGIRNIHFSYDGTATFGDGFLKVGQYSTDFCLYMMRFYNRALESGEVLANFINTIVDGDEFTRAGVRDDNDILDNSNVDYQMAKKAGYNIMVVETNATLPSIESSDSSGKTCTLHMWFGSDNDSRNFSVTNCKLSGQGTTSMQYYRWNLRFKMGDNSLWTYSDYSTSTKKGYFDGKNVHPKVADIVAKKNYASAMQGHKMGSVALYDDLYKKVVGTSALPVGARVAVYQYPVLGFQKFGDGSYQFIGIYTVGPHKGDKGTFGYDDSVYPSLMSLEGPNHSPLGTRFLHAWQNVDYDYTEETLTFGGQEGWDADYIAGRETDSASDKADILSLYEQEWKPAYEQVFFCSPYLASLADMDSSYNTIAKINSAVGTFRDTTIGGKKAELFQIYDPSNYKLYAYNNLSKVYAEVTHDMLDYLDGYLDGSVAGLPQTYVPAANAAAPTCAELIEARKWKFRMEASNFWATDSLLFHYCFCVLIAATDNFAKNMYPFKFKPLSQGGRWAFRQDDLDSILDTDNNGQQTKKYSVLPGDVTGDGVQIYQGGNSALYALVETAFSDMINARMLMLVNAASDLAGELGVAGDTKHETLFNVFAHYYWNQSAKYFPAEAYNKDTEWSYITPWMANPNKQYNNVYPLTQARGDAQYSEREWVKKHIAFIFSRYLIGGFTGASNDYGIISFTTTEPYTFNVKPAIDLYPVFNIGGGSNIQGARTPAGSACQMTVGSTGDTTIYILGANWLSELGDLKGLQLTTRGGDATVAVELAITGRRLRKLKFGDVEAASVLFNSSSIALSDTPALEEFDARNVKSLTKAVNLSDCKRLRTVLFAGSTCPGVILPEGAQLEQVSFPNSLDTLFLKSLPTLTTESLLTNEDTKLADITKATIRGLYVQNCPNINPISLITDLWFSGGPLQYFTLMWDSVTCTKDDFKALYYIAQGKALDLSDSSSDSSSSDSSSSDGDEIRTKDRVYGNVSYENGETSTNAGTPIIEGNVYVDDYISAEEWEMLHATWPTLNITARGRIINFEDPAVKAICVANWGGVSGAGGVAGVEGEITMEQAAKVSSIGTYFQNNSVIESFNELKYFGITSLGNFVNCSNLKYLSTPYKMTKFGEISNCKALRKIIFNEGYTSATYSMFNNMGGVSLTFVFPTTLTYFGGSIFRNTQDRKNFIYIFKGNVGNFTELRATTAGFVPSAIYVADQYFENYQEYLTGYLAYNKLHRLSEYVES